MSGVDYYSTIQSIINVITPNTANSNSANAYVQTIGGRCNRGGGGVDAGKLNTQLKHLEERVSTTEHACIGLYLTLCDVAKNMAESSDPEIKKIGEEMRARFYDGSRAGMINNINLGATVDAEGDSQGNPAGGHGGDTGPGGSSGGSNRGNILDPANTDILQANVSIGYNSFVGAMRNSTANTYGEEVSALNASQGLIRAEYSSSVVITR